MKIDILSLFPEMYNGPFSESIIKRAQNDKKIEINIHNFRDYSLDPHKNVDDTPFGGGSGMVLCCQPIFDCINALKTDDSVVIMMSPSGKTYNQKMAYDLSKKKHLIILCGHYEGFDERIIDEDSSLNESFNNNLLDYPVYTKPRVFNGMEVPEVLLSGDHKKIAEYRKNEQIRRTKEQRPDLLTGGENENKN